MTHNHTQQTGKHGEALAAAHLQADQYQVIATNWRCKQGEIDIIARQNAPDAPLVFVEVRTRRARTTEHAFQSITPHKQKRMIRTAYAYLGAHDLPEETPWRIDVVAVALWRDAPPRIQHVEDALGW